MKKCKKKWRWPSKKKKEIWYKYNNYVVFVFASLEFSDHDFFGWYCLFNIWFWWFWQWPQIMKKCSEIVRFLSAVKLFPSLEIKMILKKTKWNLFKNHPISSANTHWWAQKLCNILYQRRKVKLRLHCLFWKIGRRVTPHNLNSPCRSRVTYERIGMPGVANVDGQLEEICTWNFFMRIETSKKYDCHIITNETWIGV